MHPQNTESGFGPKEADAAAAAGEEGALPQGGASSRSGYSSGDERASSLAPGTQDLSNDRTSNATGTGNATSGSWYSLESLYSLSSMSDLEVSESNDNGQERFVPGPKPRAQRPSKMSLVGLGFKPSVALKRPLRPLGGPAAPGGARQLQQHRKEASPAYTSKEQSAGSTAAADEHRTEHQQEQSRAGEAATGPEEAKAEASAAAPSLEDATPAAERVVGASSGGPHDQQDKEGLQSIRRL